MKELGDELANALRNPPRCVCPPVPDPNQGGRVRQPNKTRTVCLWCGWTLSPPQITDAQAALLTRALAEDAAGIYIYGSEVRVARALEKLGLLILVDDGKSPMGGNRDGERWSIELCDRARCAEILNARSAK